MKIIGLTGPSGSGKSLFCLAAKQFKNVTFIDTDITARQVVQKGKPCLDELTCAFGSVILLPDGNLNRKKLASICFSDPLKHKELNKITHAFIIREIKLEIENLKKQGFDAVIIDAPLLFESGLNKICDQTVCVIAPYQTRLERILSRDGIDKNDAILRLDSQKNDEFYTSQSHICITNNSTTQQMLEQSGKILLQILEQRKSL